MSEPTKGISAAVYDRHSAACAKMRRAEEALHSAMAGVKSAAMSYVRAEADAAGDRATEVLVSIAASCAATWSNGVLSENNIIETCKRREALELLRQIATVPA